MTATAGRVGGDDWRPGHEEALIEELRRQVARYPSESHPVHHAAARFHLGVALANAGHDVEAEECLVIAARLFGEAPLPAEEAKALNALGAVLRMTGRAEAAAEAFGHAARRFEAHDEKAELATVTYNLALAHKDLGATDEAVALLRRALDLVDSAARRDLYATIEVELGALLLQTGDVDAARAALTGAKALARRAGNLALLGRAANVLGLVHLASGRPEEARQEFDDALGAHPRSIRPAEHAMAKSNLALALERAGNVRRARLSAAQVLAVPGVSGVVRNQAEGALARLGRDPADLVAVVLEEDSTDRRTALIREELVRLLSAGREERAAAARAWTRGAVTAPGDAAGVLEPWLAAMLELSPHDMEMLVLDAIEALGQLEEELRARFVDAASRAMVRFHVPQWTRLKETFNRMSSARGLGAMWA